MRITIADVRQSRLPQLIGRPSGDIPSICQSVNAATQRLLYAGGESGFWHHWRKVVFNVSVSDPYITLPRELDRAINLRFCNKPIRIQNEFYQFLPGAVQLSGCPTNYPDWCGTVAGEDCGVYPTSLDVDDTNQHLRAYVTNAADVGKKLLITGLDENALSIYTTLGSQRFNGFYMVLASPFVDSLPYRTSRIDAVQKDVTMGDVVLKQVDMTTGAEVTLSRYAPTETNPAYRRYHISHIPTGCCEDTGTVQVTAICKLAFIPVYQDTDQLIVGNIEALIEECQAIRLAGMDTATGLQQAAAHHAAAIRLLNQELRHQMGDQNVAVNVDSMEGQSMERAGIGTLI